MKLYILIFASFISYFSQASLVQFGLGGLTPHFSKNKRNYCNQWNNTGVIVNKSYYIRYFLEPFGIMYMQGNDSICSDIEGLFFHYTFSKSELIDTRITLGGYSYNQSSWDEHKAKTPSGIDAPAPVRMQYFGRDIVPVLAYEVGVHLIRRDNWSLILNNLFTPVIFSHSLAFELRF